MCRPRLLAPLLALVAAACGTAPIIEGSAKHAIDPVVIVHGASGDELAVSTDYGIVFLGKTAQTGHVEYTVWFGDGPSREEGVIEPMGNGVYATQGEILLPCVAVCFDPPPPGTKVIVRGRRGAKPYEIEAFLAADPRVTGVLLEQSDELDDLGDDSFGAGIFFAQPKKPLQLVGLVSGRLEVEDRRYVTAVGPEDLWRLVVHRRNSDRPRRWVYREDLM